MIDATRIPAIEGEHLLKSLRASDFDIPSAIGELIDNSLQAEAKNIHVYIEDEKRDGKRKKYSVINKIICADDGYGMNGAPCDTLHKCIRLGYSTRYDDRDGIGRFGVGMTLAGIRFATRIEVYSKESGKPWYYISFDLNDEEDISEGIALPIESDPPARYLPLLGRDQGTMVIWSRFDKYAEQDLHSATYHDDIDGPDSADPYGYLKHWIGRTYRKFIWKGINIYLNNKEVHSFDPLFINKEKNQFPDDAPATLAYEITTEWPVSSNVSGDGKGLGKIHIKVSELPEMYRQVRARGGTDFKGRYIDENEGISILRSDREVLYDTIPFFGESRNKRINFEDKDRWWGCEISFSPELDESFTVKNIKRGALPIKELKEELYRHVKPVRDHVIEDVQTFWKESDPITKSGSESADSPHSAAEKIAKTVRTPDPPKAGANLPADEEKHRLDGLLQELEEMDKKAVENKFQSQDFTVFDRRWRGDTFIEMSYIGGKAALLYNLNHVFFEVIAEIKGALDEREDSTSINYARQLQDMIDILMMSFVKSRQGFGEEEKYNAKTLFDFAVRDWGRYLQTYTEAYIDEHSPEDEG